MIESHLKWFFEKVKVVFREAQMEMDINTELTELRNEASFLRKENFDLKEKIQDWVRPGGTVPVELSRSNCPGRTVPAELSRQAVPVQNLGQVGPI